MRDVNSLLREKELAIGRLRKEIEALHLAIPLLAESRDWIEHGMASPPPIWHQLQGGTTRLRPLAAFARDAEASGTAT